MDFGFGPDVKPAPDLTKKVEVGRARFSSCAPPSQGGRQYIGRSASSAGDRRTSSQKSARRENRLPTPPCPSLQGVDIFLKKKHRAASLLNCRSKWPLSKPRGKSRKLQELTCMIVVSSRPFLGTGFPYLGRPHLASPVLTGLN